MHLHRLPCEESYRRRFLTVLAHIFESLRVAPG